MVVEHSYVSQCGMIFRRARDAPKKKEKRTGFCNVRYWGESAQRDTTTEKPRVMAAGSTHQADEEAAEKNPQYLAADI